jgi:hypothetical protein
VPGPGSDVHESISVRVLQSHRQIDTFIKRVVIRNRLPRLRMPTNPTISRMSSQTEDPGEPMVIVQSSGTPAPFQCLFADLRFGLS